MWDCIIITEYQPSIDASASVYLWVFLGPLLLSNYMTFIIFLIPFLHLFHIIFHLLSCFFNQATFLEVFYSFCATPGFIGSFESFCNFDNVLLHCLEYKVERETAQNCLVNLSDTWWPSAALWQHFVYIFHSELWRSWAGTAANFPNNIQNVQIFLDEKCTILL